MIVEDILVIVRLFCDNQDSCDNQESEKRLYWCQDQVEKARHRVQCHGWGQGRALCDGGGILPRDGLIASHLTRRALEVDCQKSKVGGPTITI